MTHDSFCLATARSSSWEPEMCICDVIAKVREDERSKDLDYAYVAAQAEADAQRDMLATCLEAVLGVSVHRWPYSQPDDPHTEFISVAGAVAALRALQETP